MLAAGQYLPAPDARPAPEAEGDGESVELSEIDGKGVVDADWDGRTPYGVP